MLSTIPKYQQVSFLVIVECDTVNFGTMPIWSDDEEPHTIAQFDHHSTHRAMLQVSAGSRKTSAPFAILIVKLFPEVT